MSDDPRTSRGEHHPDPSQRRPYQAVADALRSSIHSGRYRPGDQLPSEAALQRRFGHAPMTIRAAIRVIRDEGLVYTVQGRGTFMCDTGIAAATPGASGTPLDLQPLIAEAQEIARELAALRGRVDRFANALTVAGESGAA
ncbi:winged helix-turn-helix domain-containing protein [Streptacidiphilus anmyonensis]|uniref:winged helix-turn-helix domain-containing protein n=1 Tax=Streptacidiphilus anmyonensis TaxID=405782 RepID=UPI0005A89E4F|nr:winged helix-turn-helix domain-containing protein [Streptacidiphilus anmyonensis]